MKDTSLSRISYVRRSMTVCGFIHQWKMSKLTYKEQAEQYDASLKYMHENCLGAHTIQEIADFCGVKKQKVSLDFNNALRKVRELMQDEIDEYE